MLLETSFATIENKPSMGRGSPRVLTGPHGSPRVSTGVSFGMFSPLKTAVFTRFSVRFCAEKVLRRLVQTNLLESNVRLLEIRLELPTPRSGKLGMPNSTSNFWKLEFDFQILRPGTWISTNTLWKVESNFQQPIFANQLPTAVYSGFIRVSVWGKF